MTLIRLHRLLAGCRRRLSVGGQVQGTPTTGRQDKAGCPAAGAMRLSDCLHVVFDPLPTAA